MDKQMIEVASLGRAFSLGALYDCHSGSVLTGFSLWDHDHLSNHIGERPQYYSNFEIVASESTECRSSVLDVDAVLELSVLFGLIKVEGSAKYLTNYKKSKNQARVTLKYEATTKFQQLSMDHLGANNVKYQEILNKTTATHVVTGILYGARAFFVFDREVSEEENYEEIQGNMKSMIKLIPCCRAQCKGSMKLEGKDTAADEKFSCKFIGDFALERNPVTYQDAVEVYQSLPNLLRKKNKENVVPLKIWLLPLTYFDSSAPKPVHRICTELVYKVKRVLEDFNDLEMRCNDALNTNIARQFPEISTNLNTFQKQCSDLKEKFQQAMAEKLPWLGGASEEIFTNFSTNNLTEWMDWEEKEIYFLKSFMNMKNTKIIPSQKEVDVETLSTDHAVCFVFTSPLSIYLEQIPKPAALDVQGSEVLSVLDAMRHKAKLFSHFAEANQDNNNIKFLAVGLAGDTKDTRIHLYKDGHLVSEDFEPPSKPETVTESDVTHNSVTLNVCPAQFGAKNVTCYSVEHCVSGGNQWKAMRAAAGEVTVSCLCPNTEYMFRCRAVTPAGVGPAREFSGSIKTCAEKPIIPQPQPKTMPDIKRETVPHGKSPPDVKPSSDCGGTPKSKKTATVDVCTTTCDLPQRSQRVLVDFTKLEMRCNDAMNSTVAQQFSVISKNLQIFKDLCFNFKLEIEQTLKKTNLSAFISSLNEWMDCQEKEIHTLKSITNKMKSTKTVPSENDLHQETQSAKNVVCFVFSSVESADSYLSDLSSYRNEKAQRDLQPPLYSVEDGHWFFSQEVLDAMSHKAKLFSDFAEANKDNENTKFLTVGLAGDTKDTRIHLYKDGHLVSEDFEPPSKPETVTESDVTHNSVTLKINPAQFGAEYITNYSAEYCVGGKDEWKQKTSTDEKDPAITVTGLTPNTDYMFRCRAVTSTGVGPVREFSGSIKTLPTSPPGKLHVKPTAREIEVTWEKPSEVGHNVHIMNYIIEFTRTDSGVAEKDLYWNPMVSTAETGMIPGLQPETNYTVRVRCDSGEAGRSKESSPVNVCTTRSLSELIKPTCQRIKSDCPSVYKLPLIEEDLNIAGCRKYRFGTETEKQNRTIILLGAAGAGKSSLINTMINYIVGVEWNDDFRFTLTEEGQFEPQAENQTSEVTVYKICHQEGFKIPFSLTVVDTPGFVRTGQIETDKHIRQQLCRFFTSVDGVSEINAVCVVVPAAVPCVTPSQKYLFDSMLSVFGKDVVENIRVLLTFSDGKRFPVLKTVSALGVPCPQRETNKATVHFKFNSSAMFECKFAEHATVAADTELDEKINEMFWNLNIKSFKRFFVDLSEPNSESLALTKEVIREREELENSVESLQKLFKVGLAKQEEIKEMTEILKDCETEVPRTHNLEFELTVKKRHISDIPSTGHVVTCLQCLCSCHYPHKIQNHDRKQGSTVIVHDVYCSQCPGRCKWTEHVGYDVKEKQTATGLKEKYALSATQTKMAIQALVGKLQSEFRSVQAEMMDLMMRSDKCLVRLKEIALKPNPGSTPEYIHMLIEREKSEARPGWRDRVHSLIGLKEEAEYMAEVRRREELQCPPSTKTAPKALSSA